MRKRNLYNGKGFDSYKTKTFGEVFQERSQNEKNYIKFYQKGECVKAYTFKQICDQAIEKTNFLRGKHKVILKFSNSPDLISWYLACFVSGVIPVPVSASESNEYIELIKEKFNIKHVIDDRTTLSASKQLESVEIFEDSLSIIFTTSGTTGESKGVKLSLNNLISNAIATQEAHNLTDQTIHLCVLPLVHVNAFHFSFFTSFFVGHPLILCESFFLPSFWNIVEKENVQIASLVPTLVSFLNQHSRRLKEFKKPKSLKYVVSAASALSQKCFNDFYRFYKTRIIQSYGLSETVNFSLITPTDLDEKEYESLYDCKIPTAGVEVFGNNVLLVDNEKNFIQKDKKEGELVISGWNVSLGHIPEDEDGPFKEDYFRTGDLGYFETRKGKRYFFLTGRLKEILKIDGHTLSPALLEAEYKNIIEIETIAITSIKDQGRDEIALAYTGEIDVENVKKRLHEKLPFYKRAKTFKRVNEIPVTSTGKIKRQQLREMIEKSR